MHNILEQIKAIKFDYIVNSSMFPLGNIVSQILNIPAISSFEVFATAKDLGSEFEQLNNHIVMDYYKEISDKFQIKYNIKMPTEIIDLFFSKGDLNIAYTSKYFISHPEYYDNSFVFIGPPTYDRKEKIDFPFKKVEEVVTEPKYLENIKKISDSFKATGGYKKAIEEICKFKKEKGIRD